MFNQVIAGTHPATEEVVFEAQYIYTRAKAYFLRPWVPILICLFVLKSCNGD